MDSSNPFALFGLEPVPVPDPVKIKATFHQATALGHPDKFQNGSDAERRGAEESYQALVKAYQTLIDPRSRLLTLYELTEGKKPGDIQRIPPGTMDLFVEVGQLCQAVDRHFQQRNEASGALARAELASHAIDLQDQLLTLRGKLDLFGAELEKQLLVLDEQWRQAPAGEKPLSALEAAYRKLSYLARWQQQLQERELQMLSD